MNAVIFPGQGAQYTGMGKSIYESFSEAKAVFSKMDEVLGFSLSEKCFFGPDEDLKDTSLQQLAILAVSIAAFEVFKKKGIKVSYLSGLSLGEYSALYAAESLFLENLVTLVRERGLAMQEAAEANPSTMYAVIGVERGVLDDLADDYGFYVSNINSPNQIVISLKSEDREKISSILKDKGVKAIELNVSGGFHSPFMDSAKIRLKRIIENLEFADAKIPIVSNFTALSHTDRKKIKHNLLEQMVSPVLWKDCVEFMISKGVRVFFEVGPSNILKNLVRKIDRSVKVINIETAQDLKKL